jgi:transposase-like protein
MAKTCRRFSTEFKLGVVEVYLAGDGSLKGLVPPRPASITRWCTSG